MFATSWQAVLNFFPKVNDKSFIICPAAVSALEIATDFNVIQYNDCRICPKTPSNTQYTIEAHFFGHFLIKTKHDQVPQSYVHEKTCPHSSRFWYDFGLNIFSATFFRDTLYLPALYKMSSLIKALRSKKYIFLLCSERSGGDNRELDEPETGVPRGFHIRGSQGHVVQAFGGNTYILLYIYKYCSSQPSMVHWLSSSIFPCSVGCPAMVTPVEISLLVAPHPKTHTFSESLW